MKMPKAPCQSCKKPECEGIRQQKYRCRKYTNFLSRLINYYEQEEQDEGISCSTCPLGCENRWYEPVRIWKQKVSPGKTRCLAANKNVTLKDCRGYPYPAWCMRNRCTATCIVCGCRLFPTEAFDGLCWKCAAKKKNQHLLFRYRYQQKE